jgi:hypothetical protein
VFALKFVQPFSATFPDVRNFEEDIRALFPEKKKVVVGNGVLVVEDDN